MTALAWPLAVLAIAIVAILRLHHIGHAWLNLRAKENELARSSGDSWLDMNVSVNTANAVAKVVAATVAVHYEKKMPQRVNERMIDELIRTLMFRVSRSDAREAFADLNILWVHQIDDDDNFEKQAFEALGVAVDFTRTTDDALQMLGRTPYNCIISNLNRPGDASQDATVPVKGYAGFALYKALRDDPKHAKLPYIIYSRSLNEDSRAYGAEIGIREQTNDPRAVFEYVLEHAMRTVPKAKTAANLP